MMLIGAESRSVPLLKKGCFGKVKHAYTRSSPYWKHFLLKRDKDGEERIHCKYCPTSYKNEGTSNMKNHMFNKHCGLLKESIPESIPNHFKSANTAFVSTIIVLVAECEYYSLLYKILFVCARLSTTKLRNNY